MYVGRPKYDFCQINNTILRPINSVAGRQTDTQTDTKNSTVHAVMAVYRLMLLLYQYARALTDSLLGGTCSHVIDATTLAWHTQSSIAVNMKPDNCHSGFANYLLSIQQRDKHKESHQVNRQGTSIRALHSPG